MQKENLSRKDFRLICCFQCLLYKNILSVGKAKTLGDGLSRALVLLIPPPRYDSQSLRHSAKSCCSHQAVSVTQQLLLKGGKLQKVAA